MLKVPILLLFGMLLFKQTQAFLGASPLPAFFTSFIIPTHPTLSKAVLGSADPILKADVPSCTIPFTMAGKLILLKAKADTTEGNFILDTGAPYLVLNSTYFRHMDLIHNQDEMQSGINGQGDLSQKAVVNQFSLGTFSYFKVETDLLNLGHIENARGVKILGLLGVSLFKECELIIDYEKSLIHLHHIGRKERKTYKHQMLRDPQQYSEHAFALKDNRILVQTNMGGKKMQFVVDCAAESNIIDSRLPGSVLDLIRINGRILLSGTGTEKVEAITGDMSAFSVGKLELKDLPVIITSLENSCFANDACINGVLGYDFLSRYKLVFNFVTSKLYICK